MQEAADTPHPQDRRRDDHGLGFRGRDRRHDIGPRSPVHRCRPTDRSRSRKTWRVASSFLLTSRFERLGTPKLSAKPVGVYFRNADGSDRAKRSGRNAETVEESLTYSEPWSESEPPLLRNRGRPPSLSLDYSNSI